MIVYSWRDYWSIPSDPLVRGKMAIAFSISLAISIADRVNMYDPDYPSIPFDTKQTPEVLEVMLINRRFPNTVGRWEAIRTLLPVEICIQLMAILSNEWSMYITANDRVPYILSDGKGNFISPVEDQGGEPIFATPMSRVVSGDVLKPLFSQLGAYHDIDTEEKMISEFPGLASILTEAFKPGAPFFTMIINALDTSGAYELAAIGDEVGIINTIAMIKAIKAANSILCQACK